MKILWFFEQVDSSHKQYLSTQILLSGFPCPRLTYPGPPSGDPMSLTSALMCRTACEKSASPAFWKSTERAKDQTGQRRNRSWAQVFCMTPWPEARWGQWRFPRLQVYPTVTLSILSELFPPAAASLLLHFWGELSSFYWKEIVTKDQHHLDHGLWGWSLSPFLVNSREPEAAWVRTQ